MPRAAVRGAPAAVLPAWSARSQQDLSDPSLGFAAASKPTRLYRAIAMAARPSRPGLIRAAELRFGHPYAVVAVAAGDGPWHGLPVFSAWVAQPEDAGPE